MKVELRSFHLNGHTLGFHPQTQKLEPPCMTQGLSPGVEVFGTLCSIYRDRYGPLTHDDPSLKELCRHF